MKNKSFFRFLWVLLVWMGMGSFLETISWASTLTSLIPTRDLPKGWSILQGPHLYHRKNLFERVNGQAELFFQYGFQGSAFAVYQRKERPGDQIEADLYDMGNVVQAFGLFSRFRNEDRPAGFGLDSYLEDHSAFFYKGKYFVLLYSSEPNLEALTQFSRLIESRLSDRSPSPKEISFFPRDKLKPASIQYISQGLLGKPFLQKGFRGVYANGEKESQLFLCLFKDSKEASNALLLFQKDLSKTGRVSLEKVPLLVPRSLKGEDPYLGKIVVLQKKRYLLGEVGFENEEEAIARLTIVLSKIE